MDETLDSAHVAGICAEIEDALEAYRRGEGKPEPKFDVERELRFALFGGYEDVTDEMYEEVLRFADYVKDREARKKHTP